MTQFKKQIFSVITASTLVLSTAGTALASTTIEVSQNGAGSDNTVTVSQSNNTTVTQNNTATVTNVVSSTANSGDNKANFNTGGDVTVKSGNATSTTNVQNALNSNAAQVDCCAAGGTDVTVANNGAFSNNDVDLTGKNTNKVTQDNKAFVWNSVNSDANTGGNKAGFNNGGDVTVKSGAASTTTNVKTQANANTAVVGGVLGGAMVTPTASFNILENGAGSQNNITAKLTNATTIDQDNMARVTNGVTANANSGDNKANFNTGGDVYVTAGPATTLTGVDTAVNFNYAAADCGCLTNVAVKVAKNGAGFGFFASDSDVQLTLANSKVYGQDNVSFLTNLVSDDATSGNNGASFNVGEGNGLSDPSVTNYGATSSTTVSNSGNMNTIGGANPMVWQLPNTNVSVSLNFAALLAYFGLSM